jgi:hypothetical protein
MRRRACNQSWDNSARRRWHLDTSGDSSSWCILERCRKNQKDVVFLCSIYMYLYVFMIIYVYLFNFIEIYQIYSDFISVLFDSNWFQLISYDFIWQLLNFGWQLLGRMTGNIAERCWDFCQRKGKNRKNRIGKIMKNRRNRRNRIFRSCCCGRNWVTFETQCPLENLD